jgi:hypothetical protein
LKPAAETIECRLRKYGNNAERHEDKMDPDVANFAVVAVIIVAMVGSLSAITVAFVRGVQKKPVSREMPNMLAFQDRFDQLQQSVDAIAVEVERIAEAQRFSAKLLAERSETSTVPR